MRYSQLLVTGNVPFTSPRSADGSVVRFSDGVLRHELFMKHTLSCSACHV